MVLQVLWDDGEDEERISSPLLASAQFVREKNMRLPSTVSIPKIWPPMGKMDRMGHISAVTTQRLTEVKKNFFDKIKLDRRTNY